MSVSTTVTASAYTGDNSTKDFVFEFPLPGGSLVTAYPTLYVYLDGVVKTYTTDYTITYTLRQPSGTCSFVAAPANGVVIRLELHPPFTQTLTLTEGGGLPSVDINDVLDKLTLEMQYLNSKAFKVADGQPSPDTLGTMATQYANAVNITGGTITGIATQLLYVDVSSSTHIPDGNIARTGWSTSTQNYNSCGNGGGSYSINVAGTPSANPTVKVSYYAPIPAPYSYIPSVFVSSYQTIASLGEWQVIDQQATYFTVAYKGTPVAGQTAGFNYLVSTLP